MAAVFCGWYKRGEEITLVNTSTFENLRIFLKTNRHWLKNMNPFYCPHKEQLQDDGIVTIDNVFSCNEIDEWTAPQRRVIHLEFCNTDLPAGVRWAEKEPVF